MKPAEIRERIIEQHDRLRQRLDQVALLAERFEQGDATAAVPLRDEAATLYESFETHLLHEEAALLPLLRARGEEGHRLAACLEHEHREQRALLTYLMGRLRRNPVPTLLVAREVRNFIEYVRLDMEHEESKLLTDATLSDRREVS